MKAHETSHDTGDDGSTQAGSRVRQAGRQARIGEDQVNDVVGKSEETAKLRRRMGGEIAMYI